MMQATTTLCENLLNDPAMNWGWFLLKHVDLGFQGCCVPLIDTIQHFQMLHKKLASSKQTWHQSIH
jgi:hypothetical protein